MNKPDAATQILIIGAGPAGLSAAIYAARAGKSVVVLTGMTPGGQATLTADIENYPGFPESVSGSDLTDRFRLQAEKFGARIEYDMAERIDFASRPFIVETAGTIFHADRLILATGSEHLPLNVPGEKEYTGRGVSYCATCDAPFYRGKNVAVVGGGNSAVEEAVYLTRFAASVTLIHRRDAFRADKAVQDKLAECPNLTLRMNTVVTEIRGEKKVNALQLRSTLSGAEETLPIEGVFIFVGTKTVTDLFEGQLEMDGKVVRVDKNMETSIPGVYAAGETVDGQYRQVVISAASGAMAAISASK